MNAGLLSLLVLMLKIQDIGTVQRIVVDSDPCAAGVVPAVVTPGDILVRSDTQEIYTCTDAGIVPGMPSGDQGPIGPTGPQGPPGDAGTHTHPISDVIDLQATLDAKSDDGHTHVVADVAGLQVALDAKANTAHSHTIADTVGLQAALDAKANTAHSHAQADVTGLTASLAAKQDASSALTLAQVIDSLYPVGSLYTSTLSTNPGTLLGRGTWSAFGAGRVMVGVNASDTDFDTAEKTGGSKTVAAAGTVSVPTFTGTSNQATSAITAGTPAGTNSAPTLTMNAYTPQGTVAAPVFTGSALATHAHELPWQIPSATTIRQIAVATFGTGTSRAATAVSAAGTANTTTAAVALSEAKSAGTPAGTNSAPAFTGTQATLTGSVAAPVFTGSAMGTHSHTLTPAGTISQPTFTGSVTSVVQPYIAVHMWKRTA